MDGLGEFEKNLAAAQAQREKSEHHSRHHKHRHHSRHGSGRDRDRDRDRDGVRDRDRDRDKDGHRHRRHRDDEDDGHRHKRSRHSRGDDDEHQSRHRHRDPDRERRQERKEDREGHRGERYRKASDAHEDLPLPDDEKAPSEDPIDKPKPPARDSWMTAPSSLDIDYVHRADRAPKSEPKPEPPRRVVHRRELNDSLVEHGDLVPLPELDDGGKNVDYTFGDSGSSWRMTKLEAVYATAKESGRAAEDVALERYGNLEDFDFAREEKEEMDRRKLYGKGYKGKEVPSGDLFQKRLDEQRKKASSPCEPKQGTIIPSPIAAAPAMDQTALNRLRAQMMKAKLRRAPNAAQIEADYNRAAAAFASNPPAEAVVLGVMDNRLLAGARGEVRAVATRRGRERGNVEENADMSIEDMVREERRTKGQVGGEGLRLAERIAKDGKYDDDLDYMDENAEKLARRVHKSEFSLKNMAINEFQKLNRILEACPLCHHEDTGQPPIAPVVSLGTRVFLTLATEPEVSPGGAVIAPIAHRRNLLECDDDEWEELRNFMKSLTRMYHDQGREVVFYENAAAPHRHRHAAMVAVPIPYADGATVSAYFREAILAAADEWSQHRKLIDTAAKAAAGLGRAAFRRCIAKEMPYFHAWFGLDGGLGHVVENPERWPRGDLFAREILGGIVDADVAVIKRQGRWKRGDPRVETFRKGWRRFDWTRVLTEEEKG